MLERRKPKTDFAAFRKKLLTLSALPPCLLLGADLFDAATGRDGQVGLIVGGAVIASAGFSFAILATAWCLCLVPGWWKSSWYVPVTTIASAILTAAIYAILSRT
jgi:hypothetical protein